MPNNNPITSNLPRRVAVDEVRIIVAFYADNGKVSRPIGEPSVIKIRNAGKYINGATNRGANLPDPLPKKAKRTLTRFLTQALDESAK